MYMEVGTSISLLVSIESASTSFASICSLNGIYDIYKLVFWHRLIAQLNITIDFVPRGFIKDLLKRSFSRIGLIVQSSDEDDFSHQVEGILIREIDMAILARFYICVINFYAKYLTTAAIISQDETVLTPKKSDVKYFTTDRVG